MSLEELVSDVLDPILPGGADTLETITSNDEITTGSGWFSFPQLSCDLKRIPCTYDAQFNCNARTKSIYRTILVLVMGFSLRH
jgi:hypothetical protein